MKSLCLTASACFLFMACGEREKPYDATGTFEATEIEVSAEQSGLLQTLTLSEGDSVVAGSEVALIDTTDAWLRFEQVQASKAVYRSQRPDVEKQIAATRQQLAKAQTEEQRYSELVADGAAPRKALDDATNQVKVLQRQLAAQTSGLQTQIETLHSQEASVDAQLRHLREELRKCHVLASQNGIVLEKYASAGEFVTKGKPLFKMADLEQMYLRAYVTSAQLKDVRIGQHVKVFADFGTDSKREYDGIVTWISSRSEFTPKTILTDDERADMVYAVKIGVRNDGYIKIGMYGEVKFQNKN